MYGPFAALLLVAGLNATQTTETPLDPAQAIARYNAAPNRATKLEYNLTIVSAQRTLSGVFLHSTDDYRRLDDLTLRLTFPVADILAKQLGGAPEDVLKGKRILVRGIVERHPIVNTMYGERRSFNRVQHEIVVSAPNQILAIE